ncbi:poly(a)-specific ribonuclease pnldc1 [Anaeramoeba flamelloides]|uniref:Poly(A)-specific ribonuclease pnldc1 n=1 Tax=Anaeramoeba flamelloides TaxID=1746091 RepID=A0ABQ8YC15_9EUKA|nr:poly(a)-specific ribonuclease pnldc1 [Anaeramoeba flamelloides]
MNITEDNWYQYKDQIITDIQESEFVAVDTEMTGLHYKSRGRFLSQEMVYASHRLSTSKFSVTQLGVCPFFLDKKTNTWSCKPYNIYCFPSHSAQDRSILSFEVGSYAFLSKHNFDFNTWIKKGVHFQSIDKWNKKTQSIREEIRELKEKFKENIPLKEIAFALNPRRQFIPIERLNEEQKKEFERVNKLVTGWMKITEEKDLEFTIKDRFLRWFLINHFYRTIPEIYFQNNYIENNTLIKFELRKVTEEEFKEIQIQSLVTRLEKSKDMLGVSELFLNFNKVLVGHNCLLDVFHFISSFIGPLPKDFSQGKKRILKLFPNIFDTKLITEITDQSILGKIGKNSTGLGKLFTDLQDYTSPKITIAENFTSYLSSDNSHEAGYDAYMTGLIFLKLLQVIKPNFNFNLKNKLLLKYKNMINLMDCDYKYINLENEKKLIEDPEDKFHISNIPTYWRYNNAREEFEIQGIKVRPRFLSKNSILLTISKEKHRKIFIENFIKKKKNQDVKYIVRYYKAYLQDCIDFFN